jgi:copper(I)-binding protein
VTVKEGEGNNDASTVTIAPNPFSDRVVFYFNLKNTESDNIMNLSIQSLGGKVVHQITLSTDQKKYEWIPSVSIPAGPYIYRLEKGHNIIKTGKFVRL